MIYANAVLLPVDMQQAFDGPSWPRRWNGAVDRNGQTILGAWRSRGLPVIHVRHDSVTPGSTLRLDSPATRSGRASSPATGSPSSRRASTLPL
jgi:nicotinamidase-related amidase